MAQQIKPDIIVRTGVDAQLYRTDDEIGPAGMPMNQIYTNATRPTYFMNNKNIEGNMNRLNIYAKHTGVRRKVYTLDKGDKIRLLDMSSLNTYEWLMERLTTQEKTSFVISFPKSNSVVGRYSNTNTKWHDDVSLKAICRILAAEPVADGYASMEQFKQKGKNAFHSEVGLCPTSFHKYTVKYENISMVPPSVKQKRKTKRNNRPNITKSNTIRSLAFTNSSNGLNTKTHTKRRLRHPSFNNNNVDNFNKIVNESITKRIRFDGADRRLRKTLRG